MKLLGLRLILDTKLEQTNGYRRRAYLKAYDLAISNLLLTSLIDPINNLRAQLDRLY